MRFLAPQKYFVVADQGWNDWDLKIARGLWSRALVAGLHREPRRRQAPAARALRACGCRASPRFVLRCYRRGRGGGAHPRRAGRRRWSSASSGSSTWRGHRLAHRRLRPAHAPHHRDRGDARPSSCRSTPRSRRAAGRRRARAAAAGEPPLGMIAGSSCPICDPTAGASPGRSSRSFSSPASSCLKPWPLQIVIDDVLGGKPRRRSPLLAGLLAGRAARSSPASASSRSISRSGLLTLLHNYTTIARRPAHGERPARRALRASAAAVARLPQPAAGRRSDVPHHRRQLRRPDDDHERRCCRSCRRWCCSPACSSCCSRSIRC